eukprot:XP_014780865.1 PREDICTED: centrosomal protein of 128 kDa-like isoform X2 [Octopus bimaculoides]
MATELNSRFLSSSESDDFYEPRTYGHGVSGNNGEFNGRLSELADNLKDTTRNLKSLDHMLDTYKDIGHEQRSSIDKDFDTTCDDIQEERYRQSSLSRIDQDYPNQHGYVYPQRKKKSAVHFADDLKKEVHSLHESVRDLSYNQRKFEDSLTEDRDHRDRFASETKRAMNALASSINHQTNSENKDSTSARVEKRLSAIQDELQVERQMLMEKQNKENLGSLSSELKQALQQHQNFLSTVQTNATASVAPVAPVASHLVPITHPSNNIQETSTYKTQYLESEAQRHKIETELVNLRHRLDHSEGSRNTLQQVVEELQNHMKRSEQEKVQLQGQLHDQRLEEDTKERERLKLLESEREKEKQRLDKELQELRQHLTNTVSVVAEMDNVRQNIHKSEQQRSQLSDHIEVLTKDIENRDRQNAKILNQLRETVDKYEVAEHGRRQLESRVDDLSSRLTETTRHLDITKKELSETKRALEESLRKQDVLRGKTQEAIKQWKQKVLELEKELDCNKHTSQQMMQRNEELIKDLESSRVQHNEMVSQWDRAKRELTDALAVKANQEEQLRLKNIENNELKSLQMDLEKELKDRNSQIEKIEQELHQYQLNASALQSEKADMVEKLTTVESAHRLSQDHAQQLKYQLQELSQAKADLSSQVNEIMDQRQDLRQENVNLEQRELHLKQQTEDLKIQMKENRENYFSTIESLKTELKETRAREVRNNQLFTKHLNEVKAEHNASLHSLKFELAEERSVHKRTQQQYDQQRAENDQLHQNVSRLEEENNKLLTKLEKSFEDLKSKELLAADVKRIRDLEEQLYEAFSKMKKMEKNEMDYLGSISSNVDSVLHALKLQNASYPDNFKAEPSVSLAQQFDDPNLWVAEIKNKLCWLQCEIQLHNSQQKREPLKPTAQNMTDKSVKEPGTNKSSETSTTGAGMNFEGKKSGTPLKENMTQISDCVVKSQQTSPAAVTFSEKPLLEQRQHVIDEMEDFREIERGKIEKRYLKLQETMRSLQQELDLPVATEKRQENDLATLEKASINTNHSNKKLTESQTDLTPSKQHSVNHLDFLLQAHSLSNEDFLNSLPEQSTR